LGLWGWGWGFGGWAPPPNPQSPIPNPHKYSLFATMHKKYKLINKLKKFINKFFLQN